MKSFNPSNWSQRTSSDVMRREESLAEALRVAPLHFDALAQKTVFLKTVGLFDEAKNTAQEALRQLQALAEDPDARPPPEARMRLVEALLDMTQPADALPVLHDLLEEDEEDIAVWFLLGCAHQQEAAATSLETERRDALEAAEECLEKAEAIVKKTPDAAAAWSQRLAEFRDELAQRPMDED